MMGLVSGKSRNFADANFYTHIYIIVRDGMLKRLTGMVYVAVVMVMALATVMEKTQGTEFVLGEVYGSWWFTGLWAVLAVGGVAYMLQRKVRRMSVWMLHGALVIILLGALLTHLTAWQGTVHLRKGQTTKICLTEDGMIRDLPFDITLDSFNIRYHQGTEAVRDYESHFTIQTDAGSERGMTSMNNIYSTMGIRLYQSSYDEDEKGSTLAINCDRWGIPVTYFGYGLLFLSMLLVLIDPKGRFRSLIRKMAVVVLLLLPMQGRAAETFTKERADAFGHLCINWNDRICPVQTMALDFTRKLYGKSSYKNYTAEQVLCGFIFYREAWCEEPIIHIKSKEMRERLHLPEYTSLTSLVREDVYVLGPYIEEYYMGKNDKFHEEVMKVDDKAMLIFEVTQGENLRIFPYEGKWYSPTDSVPDEMMIDRKTYFQCALQVLGILVQKKELADADEMLEKIALYQRTYGANDMPSPTRLKAERLYNSIPFATILFMVCLTFALLSLLRWKWMKRVSFTVLALSFAALTLCLTLRWIISGYIPMTNGYETMLIMAWMIMLASLLVYRKFPIILTFGLLLSGFLLLVSHLGQMDPQITPIMPVLASPLLSVHVSCVMMAYGLFSITFMCGIYALIIRKKTEEMHILSQLFLYPAEFLLTAGIFIGAIWANVSWGRYWGWDPKEVWALITMLVYAIPMHSTSLAWMRKPSHYHWFMVVAFLAVLITYFGVNFFLGGLHSYAN